VAALIVAACAAPARTAVAPAADSTFTNPIVRSRPAGDPWVIRHGGFYYFTATLAPDSGLWVWRSRTLTGLDSGEKVKVWSAPASGPTSRQIWAPELHFVDARWYLYFTASDGIDDHHRHYVLASRTDDPLGSWDPPVRVDPALEHYAIDGSLLRLPDGRLYFMYAAGGIYVAPMDSPTHVSGPGVRILAGSEPWEHGWRRTNGRWEQDSGYWVEAPEALLHAGRTFVVYSAGHTATPHYYLGLLELTGRDPLDSASWTHRRTPLFAPYEGPDGAVYTPGHNSFTTSPDGTEDWIVYHAKDGGPDSTGGNDRSPRTVRAQRFTWNADGTPELGHPVPSGVRLQKPSGE
jgi:GH43 family beta-xylosidase